MQVQQEIERFTQDMLYFDQHRQELLQQYPERWVAICNQQVVGAIEKPKTAHQATRAQGHTTRPRVS